MSLPHINWRYVGSTNFGTAGGGAPTVTDALNALSTLASRTTYFDGEVRTPGTASAGTWTPVSSGSTTDILFWTPPGPPPAGRVQQRVMIGGSATPQSGTPMVGSETFATDALHVTLVKNVTAGPPANTSTAWSSTPFTTGEHFGWGKFYTRVAGQSTIYLWEATECVAIVITNIAGTTAYGFIAGAIIDPETNDTTADAEVDGRLYGIIRSGSAVAISPTFYTDTYVPTGSASSSRFLCASHASSSNSATNTLAFAGCFAPNTSTVIAMSPMTTFVTQPTTATLRTRSGQFGRMGLVYRNLIADNLAGRLREIYMFSDTQLSQRLAASSTTVGYIISGSSTSNSDGILLEHA